MSTAAQPPAALPANDASALATPDRSRQLETLAEHLRQRLGRPVDAMQVAAALEAEGVTDRSALFDYDCADVFALAEVIFQRLAATVPAPSTGGPSSTGAGYGGPGTAARDLSRGLLYLMPSALFPAALAVVGSHLLVPAVVAACTLGWVWSGGTAWLAYRLLGRGLLDTAGRLLRWSALVSLPLAAALGAVVAGFTGGGPRLIGLMVGLLGYQMASMVALFYQREGWLFVVMAPAVAAGLWYLVFVRPSAAETAGVWAACIGIAFAAAIWQTTDTDRPSAAGALPPRAAVEPGLRSATGPELTRLGQVLIYTALTAALLLVEDARHLSGQMDLAFAAVPLILGMGVVEWRARLFRQQAGRLLDRLDSPRRFAISVWLRLAIGLLVVTTALCALAVALVLLLHRGAALTPAGIVLIGAHVVVGGGYFLVFILAGLGRYAWVGAALAASLGVHIVAVAYGGDDLSPLRDASVFFGSVLLLQVLLIVMLARVVSHPWRYR